MFDFLRNFLSRDKTTREEQPQQPSSEQPSSEQPSSEIERLKEKYNIDPLREQYIRSYLIYQRKEYRKKALPGNFKEILQYLAQKIGIKEEELGRTFLSVIDSEQNQVSEKEKPESQGQKKQQQEQGQEQSETEEKNPKDVFIDNLISQHGDKLNKEIAGAIFDLLSDLRTYENDQKLGQLREKIAEKIAKLDVEIDKFRYDKAKIEVAKEYFDECYKEAQNTNAEFNEAQVKSRILTDLVIREIDLVRQAEVEKWPPEKKRMIAKMAAPVVALLDKYLKLNPTVRLVFSTSAVAILSGALGVIPVSAVPGVFLLRLGRSTLATGVSLLIGKTIESIWGKRIKAGKEEGIRDVLGLAYQETESSTQQEELLSGLIEKASRSYEKVLERFKNQQRWKTFFKGLAMVIAGRGLLYALSSYFPISVPESVQTLHTPSVSPEHTPGVQAPSEHTTIPEHQGVTGQTDTGMETKTPSSPAPEAIPSETQSKVFTWKFGNLNPLEVHQVSPDQVEIAGQNYPLITHDGKHFIKVPYDANHDGLQDGNYEALIDLETGKGVVNINGKEVAVYAYDKDAFFPGGKNNFGLVARSHAMVDVTGDGKVEFAVWVDKEGVVHLSHNLNPEGLSINGQPYEEWIKSNQENIKNNNFNIFDLNIRFEKFVPDPSRVDLYDPESVAEDLARQIAAVDPNNYRVVDNQLIVNAEQFERSKQLWKEYLQQQFSSNPKLYQEIQNNRGLKVESFNELRESFEDWVTAQETSIQKEGGIQVSEPKKVVVKGSLGEKGIRFNIESKESLPTINVEVGETNIPYIDPYAPEKHHTLTVVKTPDNHIKINYDGRTIGEGFVRQRTFYIEYTIREGDPEAVRAFNAARANLMRAARGENMTPYILFRLDNAIIESEISGIDNNLKDVLNDLIYKSDKSMDQVINELIQMIKQEKLNEDQFVAYYTGMLSKIFQIREFDPELSSSIGGIFSKLKSPSPYDQANAIKQLEQLVGFLKFK